MCRNGMRYFPLEHSSFHTPAISRVITSILKLLQYIWMFWRKSRMHMYENKDHIFWEGHKNMTKSSNFFDTTKGQLTTEWIYEVIVSPKMPTKNFKDFCPGSLLEGRAEILAIFGWHFGRNDDLINSFWS